MGILALIISAFGVASDTIAVTEKFKEYFKDKNNFETILANALEQAYEDEKQNLDNLSKDDQSIFKRADVIEELVRLNKVDVQNNEELEKRLLPILQKAIVIIGPKEKIDGTFNILLHRIVRDGIEKFWILLNNYDKLVNAILVSNSRTANIGVAKLLNVQELQVDAIDEIKNLLKKLSEQVSDVGLSTYNADKETATPIEQKFDSLTFKNPFALVRSEDFNHNYSKLANLFQSFTEWAAVQSRTSNVFIVGGRGTGKSMILRRMSIQTIISDYHNKGNKTVKIGDLDEDYYGIYIKLIRGTFDTYDKESAGIPDNQLNLLAQHELNICIVDAFRDSIKWLIEQNALTLSEEKKRSLLKDITNLLEENGECNGFDDLDKLIKREQKAIHRYFRNRTFELSEKYDGNATPSTYFVSQLAEIFRRHFSELKEEFRLMLLIDEYEALAKIQQIAINNIIKNRLPDLTVKLAMRKDSVKSKETFTEGEPIQEPRDFQTLYIDYETGEDEKYIALLKGICEKRLRDSGYTNTKIEDFLIDDPSYIAPMEPRIDEELELLWQSSEKRRNPTRNQEFNIKYRQTAIHRIYNSKIRQYPYHGFEQYKFLSHGIISNFLELCKYTFYFALKKQQNLLIEPGIKPKIQIHSVYYVSEKLFHQIEGNVTEVGALLKRFITDLASLIRIKLLKHSSETECNRVAILDFDVFSRYKFSLLEKVILKGNTWSVIDYLRADETMASKNTSSPKQNEIVINRIYCPHLGMPARSRWRIRISADDLSGLLTDKHDKSFKAISSKILTAFDEVENESEYIDNDPQSLFYVPPSND